jgi:type IV pilus assembly protein PilB|tara:strand:+ start:653 stop:982 length:330 start_codon:yes stop_codon:yes gene_type:complete
MLEEIMLRAAQTGHLVLTTLHTLSAAASLTRLRNIGIPLCNLVSTVSPILAQRLARRLCERCKDPPEIPQKALAELGLIAESRPNPILFRAKAVATVVRDFEEESAFMK